MLNTAQSLTGSTIISQNIPAEQPFPGYTRIIANQKEFLLGNLQLRIWRKIGEHEQISVSKLAQCLQDDGLDISFEDVMEIITLFVCNGLVKEIEDTW